MNKNLFAFLSYANIDDRDGKITTFRKELSYAVTVRWGDNFDIFQDTKDIKWGKKWEKIIESSIDAVLFFIPILTPSYFSRENCRNELKIFLESERNLSDKRFILPIYFIECGLDKKENNRDVLLDEISKIEYMDWRQLYLEPFKTLHFKKIHFLAQNIVDILKSKVKKNSKEIKTEIKKSIGDIFGLSNFNKTLTQEYKNSRKNIFLKSKKSIIKQSVLIVDQEREGCFNHISDAIELSKPGDRILIQPGNYSETLFISKPLEIIGVGDRRKIIINSSMTTTIFIENNFGRVSNLTVKNENERENSSAIFLKGSRYEINSCNISSKIGPGIVAVEGAKPYIKGNDISSFGSFGLCIGIKSNGNIEDNDIHSTKKSGILISDYSNPVIRYNIIHDCKMNGIVVVERGLGIIESNKIFRCSMPGIAVVDFSKVNIRENLIESCKHCGVLCNKNGIINLDFNDIRTNQYCGVYLGKSQEKSTLFGNKINENNIYGIYFDEGSRAIVSFNNLSNNVCDPYKFKKETDYKNIILKNNTF